MIKEDPLVIVALQTKMGHCMKASGRVDEAVSYFERAKGIVEQNSQLNFDEDERTIHVPLAECYTLRQLYDKADQLYNTVLMTYPFNQDFEVEILSKLELNAKLSHKAELRVDYLIRLLPIYIDLDSYTFDRIYYVYTELSALYQSPPLSQQGTALAFIQSALAKLDSMEQQK
jgi:tetratricopeptide (TPR) repeat protein